MRRTLFLVLLMCAMSATAQQLQVQSFKLEPTDVTASTERRMDDNGNPCALIKVQTTEKIAKVDGDVVGDILDRGTEKWIYVKRGTNQLRITIEGGSSIDINFANFQLSSAKGLLTYKMIISGQSAAGESKFQESIQFMNNNEPEKALQSIRESVEAGFPPAFHALALFYLNEWGVKKDMNKVLEYLQQGVDLNEANAEYMMSNLYFNGDGVEKDIPKALTYLEKAAQQGHANAQFDLGTNIMMGNHTERDPVKGREWIQKAAEQDVAGAQFTLGTLFFVGGGGLDKDKEQAIIWLQKAADQDYAQAIPMIATVYVMDGNMEKATEYYKKGAMLEEPTSMAFIGGLYIMGEYGIQKDYIKGFQMLKKAEEAGSPNNQILAMCYENGWGTAKNKKLARQYKEKAEEDARNRNKNIRGMLNKVR